MPRASLSDKQYEAGRKSTLARGDWSLPSPINRALTYRKSCASSLNALPKAASDGPVRASDPSAALAWNDGRE